MKTSTKTSLIIIALAVVAGVASLVWLRSRSHEPVELAGESVLDASHGPAFEVRVVMPRSGLPLGGILPDWFVKEVDGIPSELRFDHTSSGAEIGSVAPNRVALSADGWDLFIETDGEGRITPGTRLVFHLVLGGRQVKLRCRPADSAVGYLKTTTRAGSDQRSGLDGRFLVELATCTNDASGKTTNWPPAPLTVSGSFVGLPQRPALEQR